MDKYISSFYQSNTEFNFVHTITDNPLEPEPNLHTHDRYEIYYFLSGDVNYYIEGQFYNLGSNDLLIINNKEIHRPYFESGKPYERIVIHFNPKHILPLNTNSYNILHCFESKKLGINNKLSADEVFNCGFASYISQIEDYIKGDFIEKEIMIQTLFIQLLVCINNVLTSKGAALIPEHSQKNTKVNHILDYINQNLSEKLTLDVLQEKFFINKYYLCHIFKVSTGFTIQEYITYKRIIKAKELLALEYPVLEVSYLVGFNDYSSFYRTFKKITGTSPKTFTKSKK